MIFRTSQVAASEFERVTGWRLKPEGLCREERCVPFTPSDPLTLDVALAAKALGMPMVHDPRHDMWALGAEAGPRALTSATAPDLELPDHHGGAFRLSSLRGQKVLLVAWASW